MHASHGADHVAPLLLALQRVARALQERHVPIAPDDHVQFAEGRGVHEEPDVARMQPVVAAGDEDAGPARCERGGIRDGEPGEGRMSHHVVRHARGTSGGPDRRIIVLLPDHQQGLHRGELA